MNKKIGRIYDLNSDYTVAENVITNIHEYDKEYSKITYHILSKYPDIDMVQIKKIASDIDLNTIHLTLAERIIIYNILDQPFITNEQKDINLLEDLFLNKINIMIYTFMLNGLDLKEVDIDLKDIEKHIKILEEKTKDLKYEDKWIIYHKLGHTLFKMFVSEISRLRIF